MNKGKSTKQTKPVAPAGRIGEPEVILPKPKVGHSIMRGLLPPFLSRGR